MQTRLAEELTAALVTAERAALSERDSLEQSLGHERELRMAEAEAHASRVAGWERKLGDFEAAATSSAMDIRVYINNEPIFRALKAGLDREAEQLSRLGLQTQRAATRRASDEVVHLNQRVSDLRRVSAECVAAQNKAAAAITALGDEGKRAQLHELRKQLAAHQQDAERRQVLVGQRERWAEEAVEVERRLFQDALLRLQGAHMVGQREVLQDMVSSRTRSVLVLERNIAIRELLGKRGRAAWARRIFDAVYRAWKDIYIKGKAQRVAADHQLHVRERVERAMREERQQHGARLAQLDEAIGELRRELTRAREAGAAEARRREREDGLRIDALQKEVRRMTAVAQQYLQARLVEVAVAHEERERVEAALQQAKAAAEMAEQHVVAREWRAASAAEAQLVDAAREMRHLQGQLGLQSVAEVLSSVSKSHAQDDLLLFEQRAERAEAALSEQARQAELLLHSEREQATQQAKALRQQLVRTEHQRAEAAAALGLQQLRDEAMRAEEASSAAAKAQVLEDEVRVARLAAQIQSEKKGKELQQARAETRAVKRGVAHRLEHRWQHLLLQLCWQGWCQLATLEKPTA